MDSHRLKELLQLFNIALFVALLCNEVSSEELLYSISTEDSGLNTRQNSEVNSTTTLESSESSASVPQTHDAARTNQRIRVETEEVVKVFRTLNSSSNSSSSVHTSGGEDDLTHPCLRSCTNSTKKQCFYKFKVEWYTTMSKACYNCPHNVTDCLRPHCVASDGHERPIVTVNRRMPGPSIQVCENDEIIVDLINDLVSDTTSIHWHGLHQRGTPYMDGVPFLTQCPISPGTTFRYHFIADLPGTHYWHSHSAFQRTDGLFGSLIVRAKDDPHAELYDVDDPLHVMLLTDWLERLGIDKFVNHHHTEAEAGKSAGTAGLFETGTVPVKPENMHDNKPYNILVNGIGKYKPLIKDDEHSFTPIYEYRVRKGLRYRFRSISNSIQNCPIEISVDNHTLVVISADGHNIQPFQVESLVIYGGERWDFVVKADQPKGVYWVKFRGLLDCDERFKSAYQIAILRYDDEEGIPNVLEDITFDSTRREGMQVNKLNAAPGDGKTFLTAADVREYKRDRKLGHTANYQREPDYKFWLDFDFYSRDNDLFHHEDFYPFFGVEKKRRLYVPQVNNITMRLPNVPALSQPDEVDQNLFCNSSSRTNCEDDFCFCSHTLNLELGSLVEIILVDTGVVYWANHPFHLHGHAFAVLGMERLGEETTLEAIKDLERNGKIERNFNDPPIKDTVTVPDGGYTVIRFIADNPGFWFFHCHISFHAEVGMGLIFHVGERKHLPRVPNAFPKCGSWIPKPVEDLQAQVATWSSDVKLNLLPKQTENEYVPYKVEEAQPTNRPNGAAARCHTRIYAMVVTLTLIFWTISR